ncbi:hypothetical protein [Clostridium baratii]|uniref:hypothetical protein n=1 Tax=Clostridium baratii TaxID=1561 RepID=UPI0005F2E57D|nr:hypothetical protein [Clostridium baratii]AQM58543.1 hypothetical protein NPD11_3104 [Clostridium baratii]KJU72391.1 hypothetical protein UC77_04470 [Clostridium baratii]
MKKEIKINIDGKRVSIDLPDDYTGNDLIMALSVILDKVPIQYRERVLKGLWVTSNMDIRYQGVVS